MDRRFLVPILLISVIFVLGCTGGGEKVTTDTSNGLKINDFSATPSVDVQAGNPVIFMLNVENVGGTTATNVSAVLSGIQGTWLDSNKAAISSMPSKSIGSMRPPVAERNTPGGSKAEQWQYYSPNPGQGNTVPYNIEARIYYTYNTSGFIQLPALSIDEFDRIRTLGQSPEEPVIKNSDGPLKMSVPTADIYKYVVVDTTASEFTYPMQIVFTNVGSGWPITQEAGGAPLIGGGGRLRGTITISGPAEFSNCLGKSGKSINLDTTEILPRIAGETKEAMIPCEIKFTKSVWADRDKDFVTFVFNIFYDYYTKESISVNVIGK